MKSPRSARRVASQKLTCAVIESLELRQLLSAGPSFGLPKTFPVGAGPDALLVADINGDGFPDIVTANYNGTISVMLGETGGNFMPARTVSDGLSTGVAHIAFSSSADTLVVATGNQEATFDTIGTFGTKVPVLQNTSTLSGNISALAIADVTGDGSGDLLVGYQNGTVGVFLGNSGGVFPNTPSSVTTAGTGAVDSLAVADFVANQPGLVVGDADGNVVMGLVDNRTGNFPAMLTPIFLGTPSPFVNVETGNFTGDGTPDILTTSYYGNVNVLVGNTGNAAGTFTTETLPALTVPHGISGGAVGALANNGVIDPVFLSADSGQIITLPGNNDGSFAAPVTQTIGTAPGASAVQLVNINGDGRPDLITANYYTHSVSVFLNSSTAAPRITSAGSATFVTGVNGSFAITTGGFPVASTVTETGKLPAGIHIVNNTNGTATLTGVAAAGTGGTYNVTLTAKNAAGTGPSQSFTLTVDQPITFTSVKATSFAVGVDNTFTIATAGFPVGTINQRVFLPMGTGITFTAGANGTATLTGTPTAAAGTTYNILLSTGSGVGGPSQSFTLTIVPAGITSANSDIFTVGTLQTFHINTTGFSPSAATITETGILPAGVTLRSLGGGTYGLVGTAAAGTGKTYPITLTAHNLTMPPYTQVFTLTVDQAPAITPSSHFTFTTGVAATFPITATGFPTPTIAGTGTPPAGVTVVNNELIGTPTVGGVFTVTLTPTNGVGPGTADQIATITVDSPPLINSGASTTFTTGTLGMFPITTTGLPAGTVKETGKLPLGIQLINNANGTATLKGTAAAGTGGTYNVTLAATNIAGTGAPQVFTLTIDQPATFTSAKAAPFATGVNNTFTITTAGFAGTPATIMHTAGALPTGIVFTANSNGTASLTGAPTVAVGATVTFTASNGVGATAAQIFTLTVVPAGITSANNDTFTVGSPQTFKITTTGYATPPAIAESGALPSGITFKSLSTGTYGLVGTAAAGTGKNYPITLTAIAAGKPAYTQDFTLTVDQAPAIAPTSSFTFTTGVASTFPVTATGFPAPAIAETGALPTGVTFNTVTNQLLGTPASDQGGVYPVTLTATNAANTLGVTQISTVTVDEAPAITSTNGFTFTAGSVQSFQITTTGFPGATVSEVGALPPGIQLVNNADGTAMLVQFAAVGSATTFNLTLTAGNGSSSPATQDFTFTVDQAPAFTSAAEATFTATMGGTFAVTSTGFPTATVTEDASDPLPTGVSLTSGSDGTATLAVGPGAAATGTYTLLFDASNGISPNAMQTFTLVLI